MSRSGELMSSSMSQMVGHPKLGGGRRCRCGSEAVLVMSWSRENAGCRFLGFQNYGTIDWCGFWDWYNEETTERLRVVICGLLKKLEKAQVELRKMKTDEQLDRDNNSKNCIRELKEEFNKLKSENMKLKEEFFARDSDLRKIDEEKKEGRISVKFFWVLSCLVVVWLFFR